MIYVDENEPIGELRSEFDHRQVLIKRNRDVRTEYEMLHEIGRGKFGRVMKCRDLEVPDKYYAAKFVHTTRRDDRRNVEREVEIMNSLNHPKLLQLFDAYDNGRNEMCIMTEYIGGGELFDRVIEDEFVLTEKACIAFMKQILQGVEFIHSQQIVHLDLKPENILCHTKTGNRIKIIDFGLARRYEPMKKLQVLFGTPEFVAPEVVNFEPIGYATDMWAIGVICYVLLSGLSPFMGDTDLETMANVTIAEYDYEDEVFDSVSDKAKDFIDKLLMKEKGKRYSCKSCLQHPWLNNAKESKELLNAKENISSFQKDPSKKSNYYIFDHSNHTITPTEESIVLDLNRKRSLLENEEKEIKRCKTPTREELSLPKKESNCVLELWQATERTLSPCWEEDIKPLVPSPEEESKDDDEDDMSWEPQSPKEEENKENNLPIHHSETLSNANEIEDPKSASSSEPKISSLVVVPATTTGVVPPSSPSDSSSSSSPPSSMSSSSYASAKESVVSCSSECNSTSPLLLPSDYLHRRRQSSPKIDSSENIFADIKDIIRNCPQPLSSSSRLPETDRLSTTGGGPSSNPRPESSSPSESFDSSIVELSNKVENTMSTGIVIHPHHPPRGRRSRQESTSSSISLVKSRFENLRSPAAGTKSPFTSILNRRPSDEPEEEAPPPPRNESLRRRSPSPVITGAVNRARGRFEGSNLNTTNSSSRSYKSSLGSVPPSASSAPTHRRSNLPRLSPSILSSSTLHKKFPASPSRGESQLVRGPFGFF